MNRKKLQFKKIDAFATQTSTGNPAGTVWLNSIKEVNETEMLQIAKELKGFVSEVGYIHQIEDEKYGIKYFSSEKEVNFCGHATIALMYELLSSDSNLINKHKITIVTNNGELEVENRIKTDNAVFIMSPLPKELLDIPSVKNIAEKLKIDSQMINASFPIKIIDAGLRTLIVPIKGLNDIVNINPDLDELNNFCHDNGIDIIEVFSEETYKADNNYRVRVFAPTFGYIEDPATGSGNSAFGYYLIENNMWKDETIIIEQNSFPENYNIIKLQRKKDSKGNQRVIFGGGAIKRIEGEYYL